VENTYEFVTATSVACGGLFRDYTIGVPCFRLEYINNYELIGKRKKSI
jgi:hypothetical protein